MLGHGFKALTVLMAGLAIVVLACPAVFAETIVIDEFETPGEAVPFFTFDSPSPLSFVTKDKVLVKNADAMILGGERDILLVVDGEPDLISAAGLVGGPEGVLRIATAGHPGSFAFLQYDGIDAGDDEVTGLSDALALGGIDLTDGGSNVRFDLAFASLDAGDDPTRSMEVEITATGTNGETAVYVGSLSESASAFVAEILFADFTGGDVFDSIASLTFAFNDGGTPTPNVDFALQSITATVPEPATLASLFSLAILAGVVQTVRRRRRNA